MDLSSYIKNASRTDAEMETKQLHDIHMVMGISTEAGELLDVFKKNLAYKKEIDWVNVKEEIGDLMWYIANFCKSNGFELEQIMETNIEKLSARFPEKFSNERAINRNLSTEREILEK